MQASNNRVLVINKLWQPIRYVSVQRAILLLFKEYICADTGKAKPKAEIINHDDKYLQAMTWSDWSKLRPAEGEDAIISTSAQYRIPRVIKLNTYDKVPAQMIRFSRRAIYKRDHYCCQYCNKQVNGETSSIDHIVALSRGGLTTWTNCCLACLECNRKKGSKTLEEAGMKLRKQPERPKIDFLERGEYWHGSWRHFLSEQYWLVELENDNDDDLD